MKNLFLLFILILVGCATTKTLQAVNGSKSDGTVKLAYEYGVFEKPVIDWNLAETTAIQRCKAWGYKNAEKFGGAENHCLSYNGYGNCLDMQVNITYQCTEK